MHTLATSSLASAAVASQMSCARLVTSEAGELAGALQAAAGISVQGERGCRFNSVCDRTLQRELKRGTSTARAPRAPASAPVLGALCVVSGPLPYGLAHRKCLGRSHNRLFPRRSSRQRCHQRQSCVSSGHTRGKLHAGRVGGLAVCIRYGRRVFLRHNRQAGRQAPACAGHLWRVRPGRQPGSSRQGLAEWAAWSEVHCTRLVHGMAKKCSCRPYNIIIHPLQNPDSNH